MNLIMTDGWETSYVADHGMVDCELSTAVTGLRVAVWLPSISQA